MSRFSARRSTAQIRIRRFNKQSQTKKGKTKMSLALVVLLTLDDSRKRDTNCFFQPQPNDSRSSSRSKRSWLSLTFSVFAFICCFLSGGKALQAKVIERIA